MLVDYALHETRLRRQKLLSGHCDTHEDYLVTSNFLVGADWILGIAEELEKRIENEAKRRGEIAAEQG